MSYRIVFNPKYSKWEIQLKAYFFFWVVARNEQGEILKYETLENAINFVTSVGLSKSYLEHKSIFARIPDHRYIETN